MNLKEREYKEEFTTVEGFSTIIKGVRGILSLVKREKKRERDVTMNQKKNKKKDV